jgi:hypothetical protein
LPGRTFAPLSTRLAARLLAGFARRRWLGSLFSLPASFLDALQGTSEKINLQGLPRDEALQVCDLLAGCCRLLSGSQLLRLVNVFPPFVKPLAADAQLAR